MSLYASVYGNDNCFRQFSLKKINLKSKFFERATKCGDY